MIVGLKLLTIVANVTTLLCVQRKKSGLKLLLNEAEVATHTCKLLQERKRKIGRSILLVLDFCEINKGLSQKVGLVDLETG